MPAPAYAPGSHPGLAHPPLFCSLGCLSARVKGPGLLKKSSGGWEAVWLRVPGASTPDGQQVRPAQLVLKLLGEERFPLKCLAPSEILKISAFGRDYPFLHIPGTSRLSRAVEPPLLCLRASCCHVFLVF